MKRTKPAAELMEAFQAADSAWIDITCKIAELTERKKQLYDDRNDAYAAWVARIKEDIE